MHTKTNTRMNKEKLISHLCSKIEEHSSDSEYNEGVRRGLAIAIANIKNITDEFPPEACDHCSTLMKVDWDGKWCPNCNVWISTKD